VGIEEVARLTRSKVSELSPMTRRRILGAGAVAVGAFALGGSASAASTAEQQARAVVTPRPSAPPNPSHRHAKHPRKPLVATPKKPVKTLSDYRRLVGGPAFPADAIALTIDDGPHPVWTPKILKLLHRYHVPALFCMIGNQVLGHETTARDVARDGHHLANHTWSHPTHLGRAKSRPMRKELIKAQEKIHDTTGLVPQLFRSPGGDWSPSLLGVAAGQGLISLDWSDDPRDWSKPGVAHIVNRLTAAKPGQILLCHDGGGDRSQTYTALKQVIPALQARGLTFVALDRKVSP
jgi:peptidoglycan-N-acetylglucosamine deacetylase